MRKNTKLANKTTGNIVKLTNFFHRVPGSTQSRRVLNEANSRGIRASGHSTASGHPTTGSNSSDDRNGEITVMQLTTSGQSSASGQPTTSSSKESVSSDDLNDEVTVMQSTTSGQSSASGQSTTSGNSSKESVTSDDRNDKITVMQSTTSDQSTASGHSSKGSVLSDDADVLGKQKKKNKALSKYKIDWECKMPWLEANKTDVYAGFCKVCRTDVKCIAGIKDMQRHGATQKHKTNAKNLVDVGNQKTAMEKYVSTKINDSVRNAELFLVTWAVGQNKSAFEI
ncbi:uncharacterized protein LOC129724544 [Wyeomyia smithii]|uniref:uncharacterized protein LOC129724544 n=1 Tax=Wyeomyia smithii TaxID=174621 RepID=UPI002467C2AB|nr:uncharacterized protein LOC129724544 [Wyeomyia smithii]